MSGFCDLDKYSNTLIFTDFLRNNGAYEAYFNNLNMKCVKDNVSIKNWINFAFKWSKTPEGYNYWNDLNKKWLNEVKKYDKIVFDKD